MREDVDARRHLSPCGQTFAYLVLSQSHRRTCDLCQRISTVNENAQFELEDRPRPRQDVGGLSAWSDDIDSTDDSEPEDTDEMYKTFTMFLNNPRQRGLLASMLFAWEPLQFILGLSYFEPAHAPPYFRYNGTVLPSFNECTLSPSYGEIYVGFVREAYDTVVETWLVASAEQEPYVDSRSRRKLYTEYLDTKVMCDGVWESLMPLQAVEILFFVFKMRHRNIMNELRRLNDARRDAYNLAAASDGFPT
jgi:hypothetical protein